MNQQALPALIRSISTAATSHIDVRDFAKDEEGEIA